MAIHSTYRQTDLEKRLKILRQQVYGKRPENSENSDTQNDRKVRGSEHLTLRYSDTLISSGTPSRSVPTQSGYLSFRTDITYLHQDLLKISILASAALGVQIILFILMKNQILNFKF